MNHLFIGGCGRSGTSLLQDLLVQHSKIAGSSEFNFTKPILALRRRMNGDFWMKRNVEFYDQSSLDESFRDFMDSFLMRVAAEKPHAEWISEKTPNNIEVVQDILETYPDSKFIFLYRDGRDVVASHLKIRKRLRDADRDAKINVITTCHRWKTAKYQRDHLPSSFNHRVLNVQYENLVASPDAVLLKILRFLDLNPEPLEAKRMSENASDTIIKDDIFFTDEIKRKAIEANSVGKWELELGPFQKLVTQTLLADGLRDYGYAISPFYLTLNTVLRKLQPTRKSND